MSHYGSYHAATENCIGGRIANDPSMFLCPQQAAHACNACRYWLFSSFESPAISSLDAVIPTLGAPYYMVGVAMGGESSYQSSPEMLCGYYGNGLFNVYPLYTPLPNGPEYILGDPPRYIAHWKVGTCTLTNKWSGITYSLPVGFHAECPPATYLPEIPYVLLLGKNGMCERMIPASLKIALSEPLPTEPGQTTTFTATVTKDDGSAVTEPVSVKVSLKVDPQSGGHEHGDSTRPRGSIAGTKCQSDDTCQTLTTDNNGVLKFDFTAEEAAGTHTITVSCEKCSNSDSKDVDVKVKESDHPGWDTLTASPTEYALIGGGTEKNHHDNHYLMGKARENLKRLIKEYNLAFPSGPLLQLNDASLKWGGKFDIHGQWKGDHGNHRRGVVIDIRANQDVTAIPQSRFNDFEKYAKQSGAYADLHCAFSGKYICPACLLDSGPNRHYHVRLLGQGIDR